MIFLDEPNKTSKWHNKEFTLPSNRCRIGAEAALRIFLMESIGAASDYFELYVWAARSMCRQFSCCSVDHSARAIYVGIVS